MERDTITFTQRSQAAIREDIKQAAAALRRAWALHEDSSPHSYRMERLYEELRAARCRDDHPPARTNGRRPIRTLFYEGNGRGP